MNSTFAAALAILAALGAAPAFADQQADTQLVTEDFLIPAQDQGIELFLRNKHTANFTAFTPDRTLLFVHGGSQASEVTFDLALDGFSWVDYIARRGFDVWLVDIRGFGRSTKPPEMSLPPDKAPPIARTEVAWRDFGTAVSYILSQRHIEKLNALGWSWGTVIAGGWASHNPDKIARLVLFGPAWAINPPKPAEGPIPGYSLWTVAEAVARLQQGAPVDRVADLTPEGWYKAWEEATIATDSEARKYNPPRVRSPTGALVDFAEASQTGKPLYDPSKIVAPTLLVVGEWDGLTPISSAQDLFAHLTHASSKRLVEIGGATHFAHLERRRLELYEAVQSFLEGSF